MKELIQSFADFPDPRRQGRIQHRFIDVLIIAVSAVIAGADSWTDIASYGVVSGNPPKFCGCGHSA
ncbi:transposase family protein [Yersinia aldovae]|uniref:transposase family protein n=1 Tax=Yersinia aldovae TaxID=29483 RepID=UPI0011A59474|nr:transposase family protein [Yersinia aldovae]